MNLKYLLLVILFILCSACTEFRANLNIRNQTDRLNSVLNTYGTALRWGHYNQAYSYHVRRDGTQPQVNEERLENFSVTSFTPVDPVLNAEGTEATVPIEISYYDEQFATVRTIKETQKWWFNEEAKTWLNESEFPVFK
ncbi:MAG: hypothetical protein ACRESK_03210 [Gammaproteobacteria bacterium]